MAVDVERARASTPGCDHVAHLNNAGASLMPKAVVDAVVGHLELESRIGGYEAATAADAAVEHTYDSVADLIGCSRHEVALVENATRAWDMAFYAFAGNLRPGDRILTGRNEYSSNAMAMGQVARRTGAEPIVLPDDGYGQLDLDSLDVALRDDRVRLVAITHVATHGGMVNPAAEVGRRCREAGVPFLLDACQSVGQLRVRVDEIGCDMLSATGRKFLRGPRGTGFLYVRAGLLERLVPPFVDLRAARWSGPFEYELRTDARRFETWEAYVAGRIGLGTAVDHLAEWGIDAIEQRVCGLAEHLREQLSAVPGVIVRDRGERRCAIVTFTVDGRQPEAVADHLRTASVNVSVATGADSPLELVPRGLGGGLVRASVHYFTTEEEIGRTAALVAGIV